VLRLIAATSRVVVTSLASLFFVVIIINNILERIASEAVNLATSLSDVTSARAITLPAWKQVPRSTLRLFWTTFTTKILKLAGKLLGARRSRVSCPVTSFLSREERRGTQQALNDGCNLSAVLRDSQCQFVSLRLPNDVCH
jgi:hypothetical protein